MSASVIYQRLINDAALVALVPATSIYARFLPDSAMGPAISFFLVSAPPLNSLNGEVVNKNYRYQFDIWADRLLEAESIAEALIAALSNGTDFKSIRVTQDYDFEDTDKLHRIMLEYSFWF